MISQGAVPAARQGYISMMMDVRPDPGNPPADAIEPAPTAALWWSLAVGLALMTIAGALFWWRFGAQIFVDLLSTLQACF